MRAWGIGPRILLKTAGYAAAIRGYDFCVQAENGSCQLLSVSVIIYFTIPFLEEGEYSFWIWKGRKKMLVYSRMLSTALAASMLFPGTIAPGGMAQRRVESAPVPLAERVDADTGQTGQTGQIEAVLRLDFDQSQEILQKRGAKAVLTDSRGNEVETVLLGDYAEPDAASRTELRRRLGNHGVQLIDLLFEDLEPGRYTLTLSGEGYRTFEQELDVTDYSQYIALGTGDRSFTLGNLTDEGESRNEVDANDLAAITKALLRAELTPEEVERYDLNGDGSVDVIDLAYVHHCVGIPEDQTAEPVGAAPVAPPSGTVIPADGDTQINTGDPSITIAELMDRDAITTLSRSDGTQIDSDHPVSAEIDFTDGGRTDGVEMSVLSILTSDLENDSGQSGAIRDAVVTVTYDDNGSEKVEEISVSNQVPEEVRLLGGLQTIVIQLGRRVAVKKVTITVTRTDDNTYASVAAIEFLRDIVPENPLSPNVAVRSLTAEPGNAQAVLKWSALPNISGYEIRYYKQAEGPEKSKTLPVVTVTTVEVSGLDNGELYVFEVTPVELNDAGAISWRGSTREVSAAPQTTKRPNKVNMVKVSAGDGKLDLSWKQVKDAESYLVTYSTDPDMANPQTISGIADPRASITGLENGTTYYLYVEAVNRIGKGERSNLVEGTPQAVVYEMPEGIPTKGLLDKGKIKSIRLLDSSNVAPGYDPPFDVKYLIDGDYKTHWTTKNWWSNEHVEVEFTEPVGLSAAIWTPRLDGEYAKWLSRYAVKVWTDEAHGGWQGKRIVPDAEHGGDDSYALGGSSPNWPAVRNSPGTTKFAVLPFGPLEGVTKIQVGVEQVGYNAISLSELMFMEYDPATDIPTRIEGLFEGPAFTSLRPGVDQAQIDELRTLLQAQSEYCLYPEAHEDELRLAEELLNNGTSKGVVLEGLHSLTAPGGSSLQPLGVSANAGQSITVYADIPEGETVTLYATQVNAEASAWRSSLGSVANGRTVLTIPQISSKQGEKGGSLYYTYSGSRPEDITLHIRRATDIPTLDVVGLSEGERQTAIAAYLDEVAEYRSTLSNQSVDHPKNVTEISTPSVLLSIPLTAVPREADVQLLENDILAWEQIMDICKTTQGMETAGGQNTFAVRQNVRCMQMFEGAFMYAAGSHIGIGAGSCTGMVTGAPVTDGSPGSLFGWGIAHEIGHNMDKLGKAEITNNIYAIMVQTFDAGDNIRTSRLEASGKYPAVFTKTAQQYQGASNDVFVQLGMYWQLHLAYDGGSGDARGPMDFYHRFFQLWKEDARFGAGSAYTYDEKVAVAASETAGTNLTEFFTRWGMELGEAARAEMSKYPEETRAIWYLNDQSRRERLKGSPGASGTLTATAQPQANSSDVVLTIDPSGISGSVQGYEIRREGRSIDFVTPGQSGTFTYTDRIGAANHKAFAYEVAAYDLLGQEVCAVKTVPPQIRIAYDHMVPAEAYETSAENGVVTFTAKTDVMQVSGVKLEGYSNADAEITVTVTDAEGNSYTAREGMVENQSVDDKTSFITYLQNPNAQDQDDTRIWTYDAKRVTVTLPDGVPAEKVGLVSYPGDDVAFLEGGATD